MPHSALTQYFTHCFWFVPTIVEFLPITNITFYFPVRLRTSICVHMCHLWIYIFFLQFTVNSRNFAFPSTVRLRTSVALIFHCGEKS